MILEHERNRNLLISKKNIFGEPLESCCLDPKTGYFRDGFCRTDESDYGRHILCAEITEKFLLFTKEKGNDLSTPRPETGFPGLKAGDRWCLCVLRWKEALEAGQAPPVILKSCEESTLKFISLEVLQAHSTKPSH